MSAAALAALSACAAIRSPNGNFYPGETAFGTHLHFLDAFWRGDCKRHLDPNASFGVLHEHVYKQGCKRINVNKKQPASARA